MAPLPNVLCSGAGEATENQPGTPSYCPPSLARYPQWSTLSVSRSIPAELRITRSKNPSYNPYTALAPTEDSTCTVGAPTVPEDLLHADSFPV